MPAIDTITGFVTAPGATLTAWTMATGDSLSIRNFPADKKAFLLDMWGFNQAAGILRVRSPRLHDNVQGIRYRIPGTSTALPLADQRWLQQLYTQDNLIAEQSGSAVAGQIETGSLLVYYDDLPGISARLTTWDDVKARGIQTYTQETQHTPGVAGGYSGQVAINANFDLMQANMDYALLGYVTDAQDCSVCIRGTDTGNVRVSGPANSLIRDVTRWWFRWLGELSGKPCIPIINAANKFNTFADVVANQAGTAINVNWIFAELAPAK